MRILFDQGTPVPLRRLLAPRHEVSTAYEHRWSTLTNGTLLDAAEEAGFDLLVTTDSNLRHQQNLNTRRIGIVVLLSSSWPRIERVVKQIQAAVDRAAPGSFEEVKIP
jgi:hypothetical protein